ncbi:MAG: tRNA threonylcarbamoyladenosine dehydratase [Xanthomonadales bacterium]|nr:tRNA threonylcarbamoyladenosine dehydratase [Xanthomonadales bacterium]
MHDHDDNAIRFAGIDRLYGRGSIARLAQAHVCIIGVGGVGSWTVEALARSGIGTLTLIDGDDVCLSNTNRQLPALMGHYGRAKVEVLAERAQAIFPDIRVHALERFLTPTSLSDLLGGGFDLVIDACDAFRVKVETIAWCRRRRQPLIVCGSAGGRSDPTRIQIRDLAISEQDAMLALVRKKLRQEFGFPRNPKRRFGVPVVFSLENVRYPQADGTVSGSRAQGSAGSLDCGGGLGAAMHVTAAFGMAIAGSALERLLARVTTREVGDNACTLAASSLPGTAGDTPV